MLYKNLSAAVYGIDANIIQVEVDCSGIKRDQDHFHTVGLPDAAVRESLDRVRAVVEAEQQLQELEVKWKAYPSVSQVWRRNWARITPFFHYPPDIRKAIYTTNSVESLNRSLRKIIKTRGGFPNEEAALKLLFLALRLAAKKWTMPIHQWREALNHFTILWPERMPALERIAS
jgi:putative transposase